MPNEYDPEYRRTHREQLDRAQKKYLEAHPEMKDYFKNYMKQYLLDPKHRKKQKEQAKKWAKEHPDKVKNYYKPHPKKLLSVEEKKKRKEEYIKRYLSRPETKKLIHERKLKWRAKNPEKWKLEQKRKSFKRRKLGFIPLNKPFAGSHGHHIDKLHVVFVPEFLHSSIWHNLRTGQNMTKINAKVFAWLKQTQLDVNTNCYTQGEPQRTLVQTPSQ